MVDAQIAGPQVARDGQAIQTIVPVDMGKDGWDRAATAADELRAIAHGDGHGLAVHVTGPLGNAADSSDAFAGIDSTLLYAALAVVIVLLLLTYRSPVLWLLPVISVGVALIGAQALIYLLARHAGLTVNAMAAGILSVLVFGAGTDYALLLTSRSGRSCAGTPTGTRRWRSRCAGRARRSSPAPPPWPWHCSR